MQRREDSRLIRVAFGLLIAGALLAGCGVRGNLDTPKADGTPATATADSGQGKPEGAAPRPHKGFILDGLLR